MTWKEEIEYRDAIINKAIEGIKSTPEERLWLATHPLYDEKRGYPFLWEDVLGIGTDKLCYLRVNVESAIFEKHMYPAIAVPGGKGKILADLEITDLYGRDKTGKPVKMLALQFAANFTEATVRFQSSLGLLAIFYQCDIYYDHCKAYMESSSGDFINGLAMKKQILSENKLRYLCSEPESGKPDALVFTVEWSKNEFLGTDG